MIGSRPIYWYGVLTAIGFGAAFFHWSRLARIQGRSAELASDLVLWLMIGGVVGARVAYVAANWPLYAEDPGAIFRIDRGGLVFYGGAIGGALAMFILARRRGLPRLSFADFVISGVPLGHAFGRIGCYLNGCCHGHESSSWLASITGGRQPVQLIEALGLVFIYYLLATQYKHKHRDGVVLLYYLMSYPALRFALEFFRGDDRLRIVGLSVAQWTSLAFLAGGAILWRKLAALKSGDRDGANLHSA